MIRDYAAEMRAAIDAETGDGPYVARVAAGRLVKHLRDTDPELLRGWLDLMAEQFVWQAINDRDRSMRGHARQSAKPRAFADDARAAEAGDGSRLVRWLSVPFTVADGSRVRLGEMRRADLLFAGDAYEARERENRLTAAFLRAVARKVGDDRVRDHYTDDQLSAMWQSLAER